MPYDASSLFDLSGKVAVVTGGSRGLGREMIRAFAANGADVVIASRKIDACETLADEIRSVYGRRALPIACNVSHWEQCDGLVEAVYAEFGRCDVLVNNAGLSPLYPSLTDVTEALFDKVIGVNFKGPFRLMALTADRMAKGDGGSIINVSSTAAIRPTPNEAAYAGAKAALEVNTRAFAKAYAPKVRVNCIEPGAFMTDISKAWDLVEFNKTAKTAIALQRGGEAEEVVTAALYFASPASSYTTGAILRVDGGTA